MGLFPNYIIQLEHSLKWKAASMYIAKEIICIMRKMALYYMPSHIFNMGWYF